MASTIAIPAGQEQIIRGVLVIPVEDEPDNAQPFLFGRKCANDVPRLGIPQLVRCRFHGRSP
jgi:hypothetical protein